MECDRCSARIETGEERELHGKVLCEDCYMDALSPPRSCDPWAVYTAKSLTNQEGRLHVNETQAAILRILEETGGAELTDIAERLHMKPSDVQREIAALRHMEKIRGERRGAKTVIRTW